jgi:energy-coupling factor transporter ATP-binding protein EcfA2
MADIPSHESPAHKAQSLPVMLPGKLSGRDTVLAQVYGQLKANKPILIYGAAGIGKTALAATLASAYTELPGGALGQQRQPAGRTHCPRWRAYGWMKSPTARHPRQRGGGNFTSNKPLIVLTASTTPRPPPFISCCAEDCRMLAQRPAEGWPGLPPKS